MQCCVYIVFWLFVTLLHSSVMHIMHHIHVKINVTSIMLSYILSNSIDVCENEWKWCKKLVDYNESVTMTITSPAPYILIQKCLKLRDHNQQHCSKDNLNFLWWKKKRFDFKWDFHSDLRSAVNREQKLIKPLNLLSSM